MKVYDAYITVRTVHANIEAKNKKHVLEVVKEQFKDDFNIELVDDEIRIEKH